MFLQHELPKSIALLLLYLSLNLVAARTLLYQCSEFSSQALKTLVLIFAQLCVDDASQFLDLILDDPFLEKFWKLTEWLSLGELGSQILITKCQYGVLALNPLRLDHVELLEQLL